MESNFFADENSSEGVRLTRHCIDKLLFYLKVLSILPFGEFQTFSCQTEEEKRVYAEKLLREGLSGTKRCVDEDGRFSIYIGNEQFVVAPDINGIYKNGGIITVYPLENTIIRCRHRCRKTGR